MLETWLTQNYSQKVELNTQALDRLNQFQFYQDLHQVQYQLADWLPLPWEELPVVQILIPENWNDKQMPYSSEMPSL